ncbi:MAG: winged helix-turn-helix domain-containing protein [Acidimicrobiales bacterium]
MGVRMFGRLQLDVGGSKLGPRDLGGVKPKQLLELLLLERGRPVSKDRLADLVWGERLPRRVEATIESYMSVLARHRQSHFGGVGPPPSRRNRDQPADGGRLRRRR